MLDWSTVSAAGRRLVRFDARGHGTSPSDAHDPTDPEQYSAPELARDLLNLIDDLPETCMTDQRRHR
jgi:3-oxoadipate enol-lactonase